MSFTNGRFRRQYCSCKLPGFYVHTDYLSVVGGVDGAWVEGRVEARTHREGGDGDGRTSVRSHLLPVPSQGPRNRQLSRYASTLGAAYNEFGYNEHPAVTSRFISLHQNHWLQWCLPAGRGVCPTGFPLNLEKWEYTRKTWKYHGILKKIINIMEQECIPVGCVPATRRPYAGVCFLGRCLLQGGLVPGGVCSGGVVVVSQHALRQTPPPPWTEWQTGVKILPWPQLRCSR